MKRFSPFRLHKFLLPHSSLTPTLFSSSLSSSHTLLTPYLPSSSRTRTSLSESAAKETAYERQKRQSDYDSHVKKAKENPISDTVIVEKKAPTKPTSTPAPHDEKDYLLPHPIWDGEYVDAVKVTHLDPPKEIDRAAYWAVRLMRFNFDWMTGFIFGTPTEKKWLTRLIFLETVAGVPGSVGGILRHLRSLRRMERDHGWIHTLFEDAENERMHLLTVLTLRNPGSFMRFCVFAAQGVFFNFFFVAYLLSPRFAHRFVGYLEEEAVYTYSKLLKQIDEGGLPKWKDLAAPEIAIKYWKMKPDSKWVDVVKLIRADEAHHRDVNHGFASLRPNDSNPFNRHDKNFTTYVGDKQQ